MQDIFPFWKIVSFCFFTFLVLFSFCLPVFSESFFHFCHANNQLLLITLSHLLQSRTSIHSFLILLTATSYTAFHPLYPPLETADLIANLSVILYIIIEIILSVCYDNIVNNFKGAIWFRATYYVYWVLLILISPLKKRFSKPIGSYKLKGGYCNTKDLHC